MKLDFKKKIIGLSVLAGLVFWIIDAMFDLYYHHGDKETLVDFLFTDNPIHEYYVRIFTFILLVMFGIISSRYVGKIERIERHYSNLFCSINDGIFIIDKTHSNQLTIKDVNPYASTMLGYKYEELLQLPFTDLMTPKGATDIFSLAEAFRENKHVVFETGMERKDGGNLIVEINAYPSCVSGFPDAMLIVRDITKRKRSEKALLESEEELRILASQLLNTQEAERQRISVGLHDELGQVLMHLKFEVGTFIKECQNNPVSSPDVGDGLLSRVDGIIEYVRMLSRELSPSVLEEIGLTSSIHYLVEEFCGHYHLHCNSIEVDQMDQIFSFETQLNIFRIFQECLTNVARHAQAANVSVVAKNRGDHFLFIVEDDGNGFDDKLVDPLNGSQRGIGISAMRQRVRMSGGSIEIWSSEGAGTRVSFTLPLMKGA